MRCLMNLTCSWMKIHLQHPVRTLNMILTIKIKIPGSILFFSLVLSSFWCVGAAVLSCGSRKIVWTRQEVGTLLELCIRCVDCGHADAWNSQPYFGRVAAGNIHLSAAILFAGATKVLRVLTHMGTAVLSAHTFFCHQHHVTNCTGTLHRVNCRCNHSSLKDWQSFLHCHL